MKWHPSMYAGALKKLGMEVGIPRYAPYSLPLSLGNGVKIYVVRTEKIDYNKQTEYLEGPVWNFSSNVAVESYIVRQKDLNVVKTELLKSAANARWRKENGLISITVKGQSVKVSTSRESRANLAVLIAAATDSTSINWKSADNVWLTVNKADLIGIAQAIQNQIQEIFDDELALNNLINSATTSEELAEIEIDTGKMERLFNRG